MSKFKKKTFTYPGLALLFSMGLLAACGEEPAETDDTDDAADDTEEPDDTDDGEDDDADAASGAGGLSGLEEEAEGDEGGEAEDGSYTIRFGTGTETGLYYPIGAVLTNEWGNTIDGVNASSQATNGSVQNLIYMQEGDLEVSLAMGNVVLEAFNGDRAFEGEAYEDVRIIGHMYPNYTQVVIRGGSDMESIADVEGRDFATGATGSGTEIASQEILDSYGYTFDDITTHFGGFPEATDMMRNNQVDIANIVVGIPGAAVGEMISTANGVLTSIDPGELEYMTENYPYWFEADIPAGTYDGQDEDVTTGALANILVADASMPDEIAYEITKHIWDNQEDLIGSHEIFEQWNLEDYQEGIPEEIPFHDGAIQYYEEEGVWED